MTAIRDALRNGGFYDASPGVAPGHSFFRLAELLADQRRMVGYEEQYAAAAAVMMRAAQLPARVVVGYLVPDSAWQQDGASLGADVHAGDISAWVEVRADGVGWVPVDVSPPRTHADGRAAGHDDARRRRSRPAASAGAAARRAGRHGQP